MVVELVEGDEVGAPPVFVDSSGRRRHRAAIAGRAFTALLFAYLVLLGAGLTRAPWVPSVRLPGLGLGAYAFHLDQEPMGPLWSVPPQQFVYRQLMYLVVIQAVVSALMGTQLRWRRQHRTGVLMVEGRSGL